MLISTASFAALLIFLIGALVCWSNPQRRVNRAIFFSSTASAAWLGCLHVAAYVYGRRHPAPAGLVWLRWSCAVGAFVPLSFLLVRDSITAASMSPPTRWFLRYGPWLLFAALLAGLCFTDAFIPSASSPLQRVRGWGYYAYIGGAVGLNLVVLISSLRSVKRVQGNARLELEVWLIGACSVQLIIMVAMTLNTFFRASWTVSVQPVAVLLFDAGTAYAITTHRIFEAGQIARILVRWLIVVAVGAVIGGGIFFVLAQGVALPIAFVVAIAVLLTCNRFVGSWLDQRFDFFPQATAARRAAFEVSTHEVRLGQLERRFGEILQGWGQAEHAIVVSGPTVAAVQEDLKLAPENPALETLGRIGWATPERLGREKNTLGRIELGQMLAERRLGAAVLVRGPSSVVICGVGVPASRRPFSYPQVTQLLELSAIFQGPLERAHLAGKMQHAEQLATVGMLGASLAHEIRNPLVSLKAFVQLLPSRYHEQAFRDKFFVLMTEEVKRIDRLTEQLLDLASPHAYCAEAIGLNAVIKAGLDLVAPRAAEAQVGIQLRLTSEPDRVYTDPAAVKQVLLNLCLNAIQVLEGKPERWVRVETLGGVDAVELIVSDSGPGIVPEMRAKLFHPFQSTKSSGFGLGLAICRDILAGLDATIEAAEAEPGCGATFRVVFPCPR
jgi:signal transduction histidine kinase